MAGLPSATSILGNTPGSTGARGSGPRRRAAPSVGQQPTQPAQQGGSTPTFAQMQANGQARPAPPSGGQPAQQPIQGQLQHSVSQALSQPSRYDLPQVQQVRNTLTGDLERKFAGEKKQLDETLASRGLSASSFGGGYMGDLQGQQDQQLANMNASLIQNEASNAAADRATGLSAGQGFVNSQNANDATIAGITGQYGGQQTLASQLGLGQLGLGQQQLAQSGNQFNQTLDQNKLQNAQQFGLQSSAADLAKTLGLGNLDLAKQGQAQQFGLAQGALTGNYNGQETAASQQWRQQLAQALGIAQMQNNTNIYGIQTQGQNSQNQMLFQMLASMTGLTPAQQQQLLAFIQGRNGGTSGTNPPPTGTPPGYTPPSNPNTPPTPIDDPSNGSGNNMNMIPNGNGQLSFGGDAALGPRDTGAPGSQSWMDHASLADRNAYANEQNWTAAQADARGHLSSSQKAGGLFSDTLAPGSSYGSDFMKNLGSTQDYLNNDYAMSGFDPTGKYIGPPAQTSDQSGQLSSSLQDAVRRALAARSQGMVS